jgi:hypothetical protein
VTSQRDDTELHHRDDTIGTLCRTDNRPARADDVHVASLALNGFGAPGLTTRLRLVPRASRAGTRTGETTVRRRPSVADRPVLVAGGDAARRSAMVEELAQTLPQGTSFEQAGALWELMARAPESRLVVLSGELDDLAPESLLHTLGHRHPGLPVVSLETASLAPA